MYVKNILIAFLCTLTTSTAAFASLADNLESYVGYKIIAKKTVAGEFEGCDFDKKIIFDDRTVLTCATYGYQYSYRPTAIILFNGSNIKMVIEDEAYDMSR